MAKNAQAEIITMGLKDEGGMIDEASGNEVPNGALHFFNTVQRK